MTGDFPDRDEWTDRTFAPDSNQLAREAEEAMEASEWADLGATDLLSPDELADIVRPITQPGAIQ